MYNVSMPNRDDVVGAAIGFSLVAALAMQQVVHWFKNGGKRRLRYSR